MSFSPGYQRVAMVLISEFFCSRRDRNSRKILGVHIIGPYAPILIQAVINVLENEQDFMVLAQGMHIHPALPEVVLATFLNLKEA